MEWLAICCFLPGKMLPQLKTIGQIILTASCAVDVVAKWVVHGTPNMHIKGSNLSAASWLTM